MLKVHNTKEEKKFIMRTHMGTVDLSDEGLNKETNLSVSMSGLSPMVEFPEGIIIMLDINKFIEACVKKYKEITNE